MAVRDAIKMEHRLPCWLMRSAEFKKAESGPSDQGTLPGTCSDVSVVFGRLQFNSQLGRFQGTIDVWSKEVNDDEEFDFPQKIAQGEG
jgi:hypothetical protein